MNKVKKFIRSRSSSTRNRQEKSTFKIDFFQKSRSFYKTTQVVTSTCKSDSLEKKKNEFKLMKEYLSEKFNEISNELPLIVNICTENNAKQEKEELFPIVNSTSDLKMDSYLEKVLISYDLPMKLDDKIIQNVEIDKNFDDDCSERYDLFVENENTYEEKQPDEDSIGNRFINTEDSNKNYENESAEEQRNKTEVLTEESNIDQVIHEINDKVEIKREKCLKNEPLILQNIFNEIIKEKDTQFKEIEVKNPIRKTRKNENPNIKLIFLVIMVNFIVFLILNKL
jgi:hypothetical protein